LIEMAQDRLTRRGFLGGAVLSGGAVVLGACTSDGTRPSGGASARNAGGIAGLPAIEGATVITDPAQFPAKLSEAPEFAQLVAAGKLPPVAERIGRDPLVIKPLHSIGKYGGELRRGYVGVGDHQNGRRFAAGPDTLFYFDHEMNKLVPNIARGYELSADGKVLTVQLRRGMRWSDGHPFTADDIVFWREDINLNTALTRGSEALKTDGGPVQVRKIDDYTVEFVSPVPHPLLPRMLAGGLGAGLSSNAPINEAAYAPKHYLSQFLPKYTSEAEATAKAKAAGIETWALYIRQLMDWVSNPDLPALTPWVVTRPINQSPWVLEANPYSIWVDTDGNQLPYLRKITMRDAGNREVLKTQAISGAYDFQDRGLDLTALQVLVENQERSKYTIYRLPNDDLNLQLRLNLAYTKDQTIGDLLRNVDFRRALSLGINRDEINKTFFFDTGIPSAAMVADDNPYFPGKEWRTKWATHDVKQANELLDKVGLTERDGDGFRLRPDNKKRVRIDFDATKPYADFPAMAETIRGHWRDIGIEASVQTLDGPGLSNRTLANEVMINPIGAFSGDIFIDVLGVLPTTGGAGDVIGLPYARWWQSGGKTGARPPESLRLQEAYDLRKRGLRTTDEAERVEIGKQIYMLHADMVWSIGVIGFAPLLYGLYLAKNNLGNVPRRVLNDQFIRTPSNAHPMTFYYT
jgi:peptide/nickel transport system substrate-binding protein